MTKEDPEYQQKPDVIQRSEMTISIISPFLSSYTSSLKLEKLSISSSMSWRSRFIEKPIGSEDIFR